MNDQARQWVHQNALAHGLNFPMSHEPWHIEPVGARSNMAAAQPGIAGQPGPAGGGDLSGMPAIFPGGNPGPMPAAPGQPMPQGAPGEMTWAQDNIGANLYGMQRQQMPQMQFNPLDPQSFMQQRRFDTSQTNALAGLFGGIS
jgi:hypothetical protein